MNFKYMNTEGGGNPTLCKFSSIPLAKKVKIYNMLSKLLPNFKRNDTFFFSNIKLNVNIHFFTFHEHFRGFCDQNLSPTMKHYSYLCFSLSLVVEPSFFTHFMKYTYTPGVDNYPPQTKRVKFEKL